MSEIGNAPALVDLRGRILKRAQEYRERELITATCPTFRAASTNFFPRENQSLESSAHLVYLPAHLFAPMKISALLRSAAALTLVASILGLAACTSVPKGQRPRNAKEAAKVFYLAGNWSPVNGEGNQLTFVPDPGGPSTGRVTGIFSEGGTYQASEVVPETGKFSMWINASKIDSDDPLSRTSFSGEFSVDGKLLSLTRHWGGGMPDETKSYRR